MKPETGNQNPGDSYADLKSISVELDVPLTTLSNLLPEEIREIMDKTGGAGRWRYHRKYIPALREMLAQKTPSGGRAIKPGTAALFLRPRIELINSGGELVATENGNPETGNLILTSSLPGALVGGSLDNALRVAQALERIASMGAPPDRLLTQEEAITEFGVSAGTLKKLPHGKEGRCKKWRRSVVAAYVEGWG